ncbi:MAG: hypothetical protein ACRENE_14410 [Polyangiaceae bacterium]
MAQPSDVATAAAPESPAIVANQVLAIVEPTTRGLGTFRVESTAENEFWLGLSRVRDGQHVGDMRVFRSRTDKEHRFRTKSFSIEIGNTAPDDWIVNYEIRAAWAIAEHDDGSWATRVIGNAPMVSPELGWATMAVVLVAVLIAKLRRNRVSWEVRLPHLLPAAIQVALYAYWSVYWPDVRDHVPSLVLQLVMSFAIDAAFAFARFGSWRIGASPLPIVLSANLFAWFHTPGILITLVTAFATKTFLRRNGRHVLNPSAAGLTLAGLFATLTPNLVHFGGVFHTMNASPNMAELLIVLALIPQLRFRIVPVTIGGLLALRFFENPNIARPALLLSIVLLATDPATIPGTDVGKLLFGAFIGVGINYTSLALRWVGSADDFSKVMAIPFANALVPAFDRVGTAVATYASGWVARVDPLKAALGRIGTWKTSKSAGGPPIWAIPNVALVAVWLLLILPKFGDDKVRAFEPAIYWNWGTPLVHRDADDVPRRESNPIFCKPFSFLAELAAWREGGASTGPEPPLRAALR